jgi:predicted kinase
MSLKKMLRDTDKDVISIEALNEGGFKLECKTPDGKDLWGSNYFGLVSYEALQNLEGKILTLIDATFVDKEQRKAVKDILRKTFWFDWVEHHLYKGKENMPVGMPSLRE